MPGKRIPALTSLTGANSANNDEVVIFDTSANGGLGETKRITRAQLAAGLVGDLPYTPAGFIAASTVPTAIAEIASDLAAAGGAALIGNTPAGTVAATTVQGAINEIVSDLAASSGSSLVGFLQAGTSAAARTVQAKLRDVVSVKDFGAVGDGVADDGPACRAAVAAVVAAGGGTVYFPAGKYRLVKDPLDTTGNACLTLPGSVHLVGDGIGGSNSIVPTAPVIGTTLVPGGASTTLIRITGMYNSISNMTLFNEAAHASTNGIRLAPQDESQTSTRSDTSYNNFNELYVNNFDEGIVLRPGPTVGGADSYCYYNTFRNIVYFNCRIGLWLKEPPTQPGSGPNRNTFVSMRFGSNSNGNVGVYIEAGDTNKFIACSFEGLQYGVSPQNPPTAIYIAYNSATFAASDNMFFGTIVEACTRAVTNVNDRLEFHGALFFPITTHELAVSSVTGFAVGQAVTATNMSAGTVTFVATSPNRVGVKRTGGSGVISGTLSNGTNTATITSATVETGVINVSPTGALSLLTDPQTGAQVKAVGTNRAPTVAGDFYSPASDIVVKASTATGGAPEFRIDTGTAYGFYSFYNAGSKQWSIGAQATGVGNISFFNAADTLLCQIRQNGEFRPGSSNSYDIGSSGNVWANTYSTNFRPGAGGPIWTSAAATPESAVTAPVGSLFARTDGVAGTTLYVKESGTGNTGWANIQTLLIEDTAANIAAVGNAINTAGKYKGKLVWDTTNTRMMRASGSAAADPWVVIDGSASVTPS